MDEGDEDELWSAASDSDNASHDSERSGVSEEEGRAFLDDEPRACQALTVKEERHALLAKAHLALAAKARAEHLNQGAPGSKKFRAARRTYETLWEDLARALRVSSSDTSFDDQLLEVALSVPDNQVSREPLVQIVENIPTALCYASEEVRGDRDTVLRLVKKRGLALEGASDALKGDKEVVLAAVSSHCWALQDASDELKGDRDVVLAALRSQTDEEVKQDDNMLVYAKAHLWADAEVVLEAVRVDGRAVSLASHELRSNKDFLLRAMRRAPLLEENLCYDEASRRLREAIPMEDFLGASDSVLAMAGDEAPVLSVRLNPVAHPGPKKKKKHAQSISISISSCEVSLLSGASFSCSWRDESQDSSEPELKRKRPGSESASEAQMVEPTDSEQQTQSCSTVADLAGLVRAELRRHVQMDPVPERIFIVFLKTESDGEAVQVTPWDWDRPLTEFV